MTRWVELSWWLEGRPLHLRLRAARLRLNYVYLLVRIM